MHWTFFIIPNVWMFLCLNTENVFAPLLQFALNHFLRPHAAGLGREVDVNRHIGALLRQHLEHITCHNRLQETNKLRSLSQMIITVSEYEWNSNIEAKPSLFWGKNMIINVKFHYWDTYWVLIILQFDDCFILNNLTTVKFTKTNKLDVTILNSKYMVLKLKDHICQMHYCLGR